MKAILTVFTTDGETYREELKEETAGTLMIEKILAMIVKKDEHFTTDG